MKHLQKNKMKNANFLSILTIWWMNEFFREGAKRPLKETDMLELIPSDQSESVCQELERNWNKEKNRKNPSLLRALLKTHRKDLILAGFIAFTEENVRLGIALLISRLVLYFENQESFHLWNAYVYAIAIFLFSVFSGVIHHYLFYKFFRVGWHMRVALCALMYKKTLHLSQQSLGEITSGRIVNLGATDVLRFDFIPVFLNYLWIGPVQCITTFVILSMEFGFSILAGLGVLTVTMLLQILSGKGLARLRSLVAELTDIRIQWVNEVITGMRIIKMYVWEKPFAKLLTEARRKEVGKIIQSGVLKSSTLALLLTQDKLITVASVAVYALNGGIISPYKVFILLGLFGALRFSAGFAFLHAVTQTSEGITSSKRIQRFLASNEFDSVSVKADSVPPSEAYLEMKNFSASWTSPEATDSEDRISTLSDVSFRIEAGELLVVIGAVGSGKSTLLNAILRELPAISGKVIVHGNVAYAGQIPWVFSGTIRENILFGEVFDSNLYQKVISACCLTKDLDILPDGDLTLVGERGVTLSGGQKARVNLARAVYRSDSNIILLDDPLSAVDPAVARRLHDQCILGMMKNKVRVLVTHQLQLLKTADHILVLNEGKMVGFGTYAELTAQNTDFASLLKPSKQGAAEDHENKDFESLEIIRTKTRASKRSMISAISFPEEVIEEPLGMTEPEVGRETGSVGVKVYAEYFRVGANSLLHFIFILLYIATHVLFIMNDWWLSKWAVDQSAQINAGMNTSNEAINVSSESYTPTVVPDTSESPRDLSSFYLPIYCALSASLLVATILKMNLNSYLCISSGYHMHKKMLAAILRAPIRFFDTNPIGRILNRFSKDMGQVDEILPNIFMEFLHNCGIIASVVILVVTINYLALVILLPSVIYFVWLRRYFIKTARDIKRLEGATRSPVFSLLSSTLQGLITVRSFKAQNRFEEKFHESQDLHSSAWFLFLTSSRWFGIRLDLICASFVGVTTLASVAASTLLDIDAGQVGLILTQAASCVTLFQWVIRQSAEVESFMVSVERIQQYYRLEPEAPAEITETKPYQNWPEEGAIQFKHVCFSYYENGPTVLKDLDFAILSREKIGLIGRTGAGKSSVISALFRLAELTEGEIYIDGVGISSIGLSKLRSSISIIPQDPILFNGTLRRNLDPFNQFSDEALWNALLQVQLRDFTLSLPNQLETELTEAGSNFSVGQRQLVCLARAILRKNKILLIDEATANVDVRTDRFIQSTIRESFVDCTVITIAHRINTIIDSDKIIVLEAGSVMEFDEPYVLLQQQGTFASMVNSMGASESKALRQNAEKVYLKKHGLLAEN